LREMFERVLPVSEINSAANGYFLQNEVLYRKWLPIGEDCVENEVFQLVVPAKFCHLVLEVAHEKDGTPRFCTDMRKVNSVTKSDSFPLPRMDDCIDQVGSAKVLGKFDLLKGYWQVPLSKRAQEIAAFITPSGLYSYKAMPFGLRNAPATFQRLMNRVVSGLKGCEVYLDDLVIVDALSRAPLH